MEKKEKKQPTNHEEGANGGFTNPKWQLLWTVSAGYKSPI